MVKHLPVNFPQLFATFWLRIGAKTLVGGWEDWEFRITFCQGSVSFTEQVREEGCKSIDYKKLGQTVGSNSGWSQTNNILHQWLMQHQTLPGESHKYVSSIKRNHGKHWIVTGRATGLHNLSLLCKYQMISTEINISDWSFTRYWANNNTLVIKWVNL